MVREQHAVCSPGAAIDVYAIGDALDSGGQRYGSTIDMQTTVQMVKSGVDMWENMHLLMKVLDEVAKVHPFIAGTSDPALIGPYPR